MSAQEFGPQQAREAALEAAAAEEAAQQRAEEAQAEGEQLADHVPQQKLEKDPQVEKLLRHLLGSTADLFAPNWQLQAHELDLLADVYATALEAALPGGMARLGPYVGAAMATVGIIGPRVAALGAPQPAVGRRVQPAPTDGEHWTEEVKEPAGA